MVAESAEARGMPEVRYLSRGEAARRLGVAPRTIQQWAKDGRIPCIRTFGGHRRFSVEDLDTIGQVIKSQRSRRRANRAATASPIPT